MCDKFRYLNIILFMHGTIHFYWKLYLKKSFTSYDHIPSIYGHWLSRCVQFHLWTIFHSDGILHYWCLFKSFIHVINFFSIILIFTSHSYFLFCLFFFVFSPSFSFLPSTLSLNFFPLDLKTVHAMFSYVPM